MATVAGHHVTSHKRNLVPFDTEAACSRYLGEWSPKKISPVTGFAPGFVLIVKLVVGVYPGAVIYVVKPVGAIGG